MSRCIVDSFQLGENSEAEAGDEPRAKRAKVDAMFAGPIPTTPNRIVCWLTLSSSLSASGIDREPLPTDARDSYRSCL